jgi:hypothetical protein
VDWPGTINYRFKGDRDLGKLSRGKVCDQAISWSSTLFHLENEIKFNYIFASEEYKEYVGSRFNDVFGFIVTGDGNFYKNYSPHSRNEYTCYHK